MQQILDIICGMKTLKYPIQSYHLVCQGSGGVLDGQIILSVITRGMTLFHQFSYLMIGCLSNQLSVIFKDMLEPLARSTFDEKSESEKAASGVKEQIK